MRKIAQVAISTVITPIGALFALMLFLFFLCGVLYASLAEMIVFVSKQFQNRMVLADQEVLKEEPINISMQAPA